ncbi:MAG: nicotinate (nicotinamide) nucleotide adenylyltransferase [Candidatus Rokubacteria bacterium RIFCSPHIGHO2_12_FULL_73_22]|nr:MAG: nicotinate (nicotinamide) nucleotide adenylyltransferase [Candidatus Rokubacteria bacterium RIFCSPHIGHO2_12_FULL_73_22]OGK99786.1 MAG: nicotinate (nicotinamide) nucleotide adenylyltransferase [Candidatus Rokubacteria bacterium RIFCSPHIGHO2_02_FULL_73_26]OGL10702.1 MAG: nicotinate (nicotinamide) nucleotide adenylyltransferase [Candidatus Rokubacteria bacterium RIFCSPLOWO2_02_FULL_73_56]OGL26544.1 MAG: nicotinate (nicotinamide) nucleotide adenylyltransferase [Candidatus Rokubacteria bacter
MARTGVLGGSFNPVHYGHLLLADEVLEALGLDRILFVPAGVPPHKSPALLARAEDRFAMVRLATAGHPRFEVSDLELRRAGPSYTVDTLEALGIPRADLFLVVGSETFLDLLSWREPRRIAELAQLVVVPRVGSAFDPDSAAARKIVREVGQEPLIVRATSLPISASDLRRRVREGRSLAFRLPDAVIGYIATRGLYRA